MPECLGEDQEAGEPLVARTRGKKRADLILVERGLAETRERAQALIMEGLVYSSGGRVLKPGSTLASDSDLEVRGRLPYVGRGGVKLAHALDHFALDVSGMVAMDVGASTGGFTDCLLQRGASRVIAVDVGHGQLAYSLRRDLRVLVMEGVNARYPFALPERDEAGDEGQLGRVDLATVDVSFISATMVLPTVAGQVKRGGPLVVLVKPQFEARRGEVGRGGVIKDPKVHALVLARFIAWAVGAGLRIRGLTASPLLGDAGNREFFFLLRL